MLGWLFILGAWIQQSNRTRFTITSSYKSPRRLRLHRLDGVPLTVLLPATHRFSGSRLLSKTDHLREPRFFQKLVQRLAKRGARPAKPMKAYPLQWAQTLA